MSSEDGKVQNVALLYASGQGGIGLLYEESPIVILSSLQKISSRGIRDQ